MIKISAKLVSGLFLLCTGWLLTACEEQKKVAASKPYTGPLEEINNVQVLFSEGGQLKVKMNTPLQLKYENDDRIYPKQVDIEFFGPNKEVMTTLRADSGRYINDKNLYKVMGNVVVINKQKNEQLKTDELTWNPVTKKVYTEKAVNILLKNTGERLDGDGLDSNQDFSEYTIRRPRGIFRVEPGTF
ncbi:LPS export ABC transporter periplasmic protein LptC [Tellurirhabdus rosea]|uniref:LPS export ABC transporter periplasmic protein LptC n=1 Tax=Tellurirhabdus rosea TaxID=2674997 RepID=UPI002254125D|nr:LPS export ABC transporter periplasmic protein LptC [Tellurirhabdus rosea]